MAMKALLIAFILFLLLLFFLFVQLPKTGESVQATKNFDKADSQKWKFVGKAYVENGRITELNLTAP